ncbi:MAG: histidine--tRNA ligase [Acidiferrobacteraceae bacterium]|jgi:histidyl-tRNA synthetase|nr:histidine--tRNA ligase [Acidiferrobacteraceae bacterium]MBT3768905.1 histidine--tRNA ligase [Acidiferrobacteraceae bacterium]MBT3972581.1 histidine--tRNA ligase [Acidiferrobacteraceae bacterium]MBT4403864.1 histidine--tRNA ligase [Acidiferrobacteraceae bacterium]MBT5623585.1 histidine--tRNA ligase [Acidiferrobacteraceae bacterium]
MAFGDNVRSVRGMNDLLPPQTARWQRVEAVLREVAGRYGYQEIRTPVIERSDLFYRSIGEQTDIVEKEMYTFTDNNGDSLTLRPEATASCVRAGNEHGLLHNQTQRFWYTGPMFRHERPQKGRYRQFHQFGVEALGWPGPDIDAEIIALGERLWRTLGISGVSLEINTLGSASARAAFRDALRDYLVAHVDALDSDSQRRLQRNPLRILDSKDKGTQATLAGAPDLMDFLSDPELAEFSRLQDLLIAAKIDFKVNSRLVRGLDYYTGVVFEWVTDQLGAQSAVCAGGRYDTLVEQLGGTPTPAAGFACGLERLIDLVALSEVDLSSVRAEVFLVLVAAGAEELGVSYGEQLRDAGLDVLSNCGQGSLKKQMRRADASGAFVAVIVGDDERSQGTVSIKPLRSQGQQMSVPAHALVEEVQKILGNDSQ